MTARIATLDDLHELIDQLTSGVRVAVDTEFHAERRYIPELFLVQVQVPGADAWIIDPLVEGVLVGAAEALRSAPWLVHGGSQDLRLLTVALNGLPNDIVDTQIGSGLSGERFPLGYGTLVEQHLHLVLPKGATLSDWSKRPLSADQVAYAIDDVARLPALWDSIVAGVEALGRLDILTAACADFRHTSMAEPDPRYAWRNMAAAVGMSSTSLSVLREVCSWREALAQDRNQPARSILGDGLVVEIAKRLPTSAGKLLSNRRFPRSAKKHVDALLACIAKGHDCPEDERPKKVTRHTDQWRAMAVVHAWALLEGKATQWAPKLALPPQMIEDLLLDNPTTRAELGASLGPWRDQLLGDALWELWAGRAMLGLNASAAGHIERRGS